MNNLEYQINQELIENYVDKHKEYKYFISSFKEMQQAIAEGRKTKLIISNGEAIKKGFVPYLTSSVKNPRILLISYEGNKMNEKIPQVIISDRSNTIVCFMLDYMNLHIVSYNIDNDDVNCPFNRYNFVMDIADKPDYDVTMIIYKK